jgi:L-fuconolactonase
MRIIDAHAHVWDVARTRQTWLEGTDYPPIHRITEHPFVAEQDGFDVAGIVIVEGDPGAGGDDAEGQLVDESCRETDGLVCGYVPPVRLADAGERPREAARTVPSVAFRDNCQGLGPDYLRSDAVRQGLRAYAAWGVPLELCLHRSQLPALAELLERCDEPLPIILDHAGKPPLSAPDEMDAWVTDLRRVAEDPRVSIKLSGFYAEAPGDAGLADRRARSQPAVERVLDLCGPSRLIFGLDSPVSVRSPEEARAWVEDVAVAMDAAGWLEVAAADVFADNADLIYGLRPTTSPQNASERGGRHVL